MENYMDEEYLDKKLEIYAKEDVYPFHMPGHKRQMCVSWNPYEMDITEIDVFDNLHEPKEILKHSMERAALLYGAKKSFYLINGSTCGILAAISSCVKKSGKILMARNCHKAVYHSAYLLGLKTFYLYPSILPEGICGSIAPESVEKLLSEEPGIEAVVITSPTYDGVVSDITSIAEIVHRFHIPLIVDEAHGAHFGFHPYFPESAVKLGADLVIQSMHKTLPSLTQTALLHLCSDLADEKRVMRFLGIYETSSPSYIFMAGMDKCVRIIEQEGKQRFEKYADKLFDFYQKAGKLEKIKVFVPTEERKRECFRLDPSKIRINAEKCKKSGKCLYDILRKKYHLQMEMCNQTYVLAMTSFMDSEEGFHRLFCALHEIDSQSELCNLKSAKHDFTKVLYGKEKKKLEIFDAWERDRRMEALADSCGLIAASFVNLYPPGIPILAPGEEITEEIVDCLLHCIRMGLNVQGIDGKMRIKVVN